MPKLVEHFACRRLILNTLLMLDHIGISVQRLLSVLDNLKPSTSEVIRQCLALPSSQWETESLKLCGLSGSSIGTLSIQQVHDIYLEHTKDLSADNLVTLEKITEVSRIIEQEQPLYMQSNYQICITAVVASKNYQTAVVEMPTGSGKTWVQCLLAKYYCSLGKKVTIIEPNERLKL